MECFRYGRFCVHIFFKHINNAVRNTIGPEKLFKIQWIHINYCFRAYRDGFWLFTVSLDTQQRTRSDHIVSSVDPKEF